MSSDAHGSRDEDDDRGRRDSDKDTATSSIAEDNSLMSLETASGLQSDASSRSRPQPINSKRHQRHRQTEALRRQRIKNAYSKIKDLLGLTTRLEQVDILEAAIEFLEVQKNDQPGIEAAQPSAALAVTSMASATVAPPAHPLHSPRISYNPNAPPIPTVNRLHAPLYTPVDISMSATPSSLLNHHQALSCHLQTNRHHQQRQQPQAMTQSKPHISLDSKYLPCNVVICIFSRSLQLVDCNSSFAALLGFTQREEIVGRSLFDIYTPQDQDFVFNMIQTVFCIDVKSLTFIDKTQTILGELWFYLQLTPYSSTLVGEADYVHGIGQQLATPPANGRPAVLSTVRF